MPNRPERRPDATLSEQMRRKGIRDARILRAFDRVNRYRFVPPTERIRGGEDRALPIGLNQTISQPFIVAVMTLELALTGTEKVLEIGTGSGYQTAILSELADEVFTVERHALLSLRARGILDGIGRTNIRYHIGDGSLGWPEHAPFDRILVTAAAPRFPEPLFAQLREGGILVAPLGDEEDQQITVIRKQSGQPVARRVLACRFVPLIGAAGYPDEPRE
jgi:protein-L-isoaspartate(D-aspartate) O-methyltransferase